MNEKTVVPAALDLHHFQFFHYSYYFQSSVNLIFVRCKILFLTLFLFAQFPCLDNSLLVFICINRFASRTNQSTVKNHCFNFSFSSFFLSLYFFLRIFFLQMSA